MFLSQNKIVQCDGGAAELKSVFKLEHCCDLFDRSWSRLIDELESDDSTASFLGKLVHSGVLRSERERNRSKAEKVHLYSQSRKARSAQRPNANNSGFSAASSSNSPKGGEKECAAAAAPAALPRDADASQLMAGYGMKRGPHGGLIPRNRPDVDARRSMAPEAIGRATKNRKSKKKQKRDEGLKAIALRQE